MKKIIDILLILFIFASLTIFSLVIAENPGAGSQGQDNSEVQSQQGQGQGDEQQGQGQGDQDQEQEQEQEQKGDGSTDVQKGQQLKAKTFNELKSMIREKRREMIKEIGSMKGNLQKAYENQNEVRIAVHSFLSMGEDLVGGIGKKVSEIAKQFNNSVQKTIRAEETIRNRSRILRFFAGGDQKTAEELQNLVDQNRIRIRQLKELKGECDCEDEIRTLMQEQIQSMELGQVKLQELIQNERNARGIWGWFKGLFGK
ncbi:hypothetical protein E3V08_01225 [Candidatus Atribacteria bacterium MT.SAG.1]|nr:hypothetical protein E3V08_01225 [Candidatus Atribacteria bacterium MT.SAG.1]